MTKDNVLVVVAHSDDEVLGCGGTIAKHVANGDRVSVCFMTDGVSSREVNCRESKRREVASKLALEELGVNKVYQNDLPDNRMDELPLLEIIKPIEKIISIEQPTIIYTHFAYDLNVDHRLVHQAVITACRPQSWSSVKKILSFEVLSSTEWNPSGAKKFNPQYVVNVSDFFEKKMIALKCYEEEMRNFPHSRSYECVEALAVLRGATHGYTHAESFQVERFLID
ncbi:GlcNAc-PI de-N-acetylase [Shewanella algae]|uniref:PIG-L deacetylase family protein n=1 Tax=Shewanella algae TaxID=38313 RepID=UPI001182BA78|nr:PIG-L family deacetylase [Shewanella algae]TVL51520.1 GlcNAc-PI de-N-acetylase [Shewanella algae]